MNEKTILVPFIRIENIQDIELDYFDMKLLSFKEAGQIEPQYLNIYTLNDYDLILKERGLLKHNISPFADHSDADSAKWLFLISKNNKVPLDLFAAIVELITKTWHNRRKHRRQYLIPEYRDTFQQPLAEINDDDISEISQILSFALSNKKFLFALKRWHIGSERLVSLVSP